MKKAIGFIGAFSLPMIALAQTVESILSRIAGIINMLTIIVVALALLFFLWGLAKYIMSGPGEGQEAGRNMMIWGIIALFVMVSVWGLVRVLSNTLGVGAGGTAPVPGVVGGFGGGGSGSGVSGGINISGGVNIPF